MVTRDELFDEIVARSGRIAALAPDYEKSKQAVGRAQAKHTKLTDEIKAHTEAMCEALNLLSTRQRTDGKTVAQPSQVVLQAVIRSSTVDYGALAREIYGVDDRAARSRVSAALSFLRQKKVIRRNAMGWHLRNGARTRGLPLGTRVR